MTTSPSPSASASSWLAPAPSSAAANPPSPPLSNSEPACLDLAAHKFYKDGRELELTTKEYRLLEFLLKRPGRALTRDQVLDAVWGDEVIVTTRSVDRCVTTLRAKIEPDPSSPSFIHTSKR